jgi:nitrilase
MRRRWAGPDGTPLADYLKHDAEGLVVAEIDLGLISLAKSAADPVGHYARRDVTRLLFNSDQTRCVERLPAKFSEISAADLPTAPTAAE